MGLKEKSKTNARLAHELNDAGEYNASVNRFYYAVFQKLFENVSENFGYTYTESGSSHNALIRFTDSKIIESQQDASLITDARRAKQLVGSFKTLKRFRVQADYSHSCISEEEMKQFMTHYNRFNDAYSYFIKLKKG